MTFKKLSDVLSAPDDTREIYLNDQKWRNRRRSKGQYSSNSDAFDFIYLIQAWQEIVGPMLASNTRPLKINNKVLLIMVKHPIFSQELKFMTQMIIDKVIERFPKLKDSIKQIKFINSESFFKPFADEVEQKKELGPKLHPFSPQAQAKRREANMLFDDIDDEGLKELFINLYMEK